MVTAGDSDVVAGEKRADLLRAFSCMKKTGASADGAVRYAASMPADVAVPFVRALMRVEAELLLREADLFDVGIEERTSEQRQGDALVVLVDRLARV